MADFFCTFILLRALFVRPNVSTQNAIVNNEPLVLWHLNVTSEMCLLWLVLAGQTMILLLLT